ncbi:unnamed protein product [Peniophora sp. CBMAI 1063]|nr:unnamed protein product [Peniophora sp. CBMAI 1063]
MGDVTKLAPPKDLSDDERRNVFEHIFRRLAGHRHTAELHAISERYASSASPENAEKLHNDYVHEIDTWAASVLESAWAACGEPGGGQCPKWDPLSDDSTHGLAPLPPTAALEKTINMVLFAHVTSTKRYSAHTRAFLSTFCTPDEDNIVRTLRNPDDSMRDAEKRVKDEQERHAQRNSIMRKAGIGLGAVAGGVLVGVTGGLAAPLLGAGFSAIFGALGIGGTAVGLLATGLASSGVVCGALFGAYGARSTASMVERHVREIRDLAVKPVHEPRESLALRLCVSGWLSGANDVTAPWTVFEGDDTFALQWEVQALTELSDGLFALVKSQAMQYVRAEIIKRTVLASLMTALSPIAWLKIGRVFDNSWMNARQYALKTGAVLADLLAQRAFGTRPITLTGYSLGALVIFEALRILAQRPPSETAHLIQDVYLMGAPIPLNEASWSAVRRVVAGRLVNAYGSNDYVLAVLCRASEQTWTVAGIGPVNVKGVENVEVAGVDGHLKWRGMVGEALLACKAPGVNEEEVERQRALAEKLAKELDMTEEDAEKALEKGLPDEPANEAAAPQTPVASPAKSASPKSIGSPGSPGRPSTPYAVYQSKRKPAPTA